MADNLYLRNRPQGLPADDGRIDPALGDSGFGRIHTHFIVAGFKAYSVGEWGRGSILAKLDTWLVGEGYPPLDTGEAADANAIFDHIDTLASNAKVAYAVGNVEPAWTAGEGAFVQETEWRDTLKIG